jgi:hypothetical protein
MNRPNPTTGVDHRGPDDSADFPRLMGTVGVVVAAGCTATWWQALELVVTTGLLAAPLAAAAVWALRREVRIRRRLATPTSTHEVPRAAATAGRAIDSTGAPS